MPLISTAGHLVAIATTALEGLDGIDPAGTDAFAAYGLATVTFASSGDPAIDAAAAKRINLALGADKDLSELGLALPAVVRPRGDEAAIRAASTALRELAQLLDLAASGAQPKGGAGLERATAVAHAEDILSAYR
ncbi:hypothetical protein ABZ605_38115 [Streptomyces sp. NPDC012765]|uniref:hypothetical protein n=1 Tax=Streptomyces sp. NPDC012765 TaxID=3155249 RepID=UPI0033CBAC4D